MTEAARVLRAVITADSAAAVAGFEETAAAADASAAELDAAGDSTRGAAQETDNLAASLAESTPNLALMSDGAEDAAIKTDTLADSLAEGAPNLALMGDGAKDAEAGVKDFSGAAKDAGEVAEDAEKKGGKFFDTLLQGSGNLMGSLGLPNFSKEAKEAGESASSAGEDSRGMLGALGSVPVPALAGAAALGIISAEAFKMGVEMQSADEKIAVASGSTIKAATAIGNAFLKTQNEFSGQTMATAYDGVAGVLKSTEGHTLGVSGAMQVMSASVDLAEGKQLQLGATLSDVAGIMQAFQLKTSAAASVADILFSASNATGQSVDSLASALEKMRAKLGATAPPLGQLAGLMVDLTDHGETGRAAITAVSSAVTTLMKTSSGVATAQANEKTAFDALSPSLRTLVDSYQSGAMTATQFTAATGSLPLAQANQAKAFITAAGAVTTANLKLKDLGVTVDNSQDKFVGLASIIGQLHEKIQGESQAQALATVTQVSGATAATKLLAVVEAGPKAFDAATDAVTKSGTAQHAAFLQSQTLDGMFKTLKETVGKLFTEYGQYLVPIVLHVATAFLTATSFVMQHKVILLSLLGPIGLLSWGADELAKHWEGAWNDIKDAAEAVWHFLDNDIFGPLDHAFVDVTGGADNLKSIWGSVWSGIEATGRAAWAVLGPIFNAMTVAMGGVVSGIEHIMNAEHDITKVAGGAVGDVKKAFSWLGTGGIVHEKGIYGIAESGPEAVIPLSMMGHAASGLGSLGGGGGSFGGGATTANVTNHWNVTVVSNDPQAVVNALKMYEQRNGTIPIHTK